MYMQYYNVSTTNQVLSSLWYTLLGHRHTQDITTAQLPHRSSYRNRWKILIVDRRHVQSNYRYQRSITTRMGLEFLLLSSTREVQKLVPTIQHLRVYITPIIQRWRDTTEKNICTTRCDANNIGHIWQVMLSRMWKIFPNESGIIRQKSDDAPHSYFSQVAH